MSGRAPIVVVGNGMAGHRLLSELAARGRSAGCVAIGAEPTAAYNRILLSAVVSGERRKEDLTLAGPDWYARNGIELVVGDPVVSIDRCARRATMASGRHVDYDQLVLATGSKAIRLPVPGADLDGVVTFRDMVDADRLVGLPAGARAVVIGGGLLGIEAATGLVRNGVSVELVHLMTDLMERQLDARAAGLLGDALAGRGLRLHMGAKTEAIVGAEGRVTGVQLAGGRLLSADLVVFAIGVSPDAALARAAGLDCGRGVHVDDAMRTSDPAIAALGECVEHRGTTFGLVGPIWTQARVLADRLCGGDAVFEGAPNATALKVTGIEVFSAGCVREGDGQAAAMLDDPGMGVYRKLVFRGDRLEGALLYGDVEDGAWYADLIAQRVAVGEWRDRLAFGRAHVPLPAATPQAAE